MKVGKKVRREVYPALARGIRGQGQGARGQETGALGTDHLSEAKRSRREDEGPVPMAGGTADLAGSDDIGFKVCPVACSCVAGAIIVFRKSPVFCWWYGEGPNSDKRLLLLGFLVGGPSPLPLFLHTRICSCCYVVVSWTVG